MHSTIKAKMAIFILQAQCRSSRKLVRKGSFFTFLTYLKHMYMCMGMCVVAHVCRSERKSCRSWSSLPPPHRFWKSKGHRAL